MEGDNISHQGFDTAWTRSPGQDISTQPGNEHSGNLHDDRFSGPSSSERQGGLVLRPSQLTREMGAAPTMGARSALDDVAAFERGVQFLRGDHLPQQMQPQEQRLQRQDDSMTTAQQESEIDRFLMMQVQTEHPQRQEAVYTPTTEQALASQQQDPTVLYRFLEPTSQQPAASQHLREEESHHLRAGLSPQSLSILEQAPLSRQIADSRLRNEMPRSNERITSIRGGGYPTRGGGQAHSEEHRIEMETEARHRSCPATHHSEG